MDIKQPTRCGHVALLGQTNAGKSTLLNALIGQKIVGVSVKPNTTRNEVIGITSTENEQILFIDTPGLGIKSEQQTRPLSQKMNSTVWSALNKADLICFLIDLGKGPDSDDEALLRKAYLEFPAKILLLASKADRQKKSENNKILEQFSIFMENLKKYEKDERIMFAHPHPLLISAKIPNDIALLKETIACFLPEAPFLYDSDLLSLASTRFICSELIREKIFRNFSMELPFSTSVVLDKLFENTNKNKVHASIVVAKSSHKPMIIGKGGSAIKRIRLEANEALQDFFSKPVELRLHVRVCENWQYKIEQINEIQYNSDTVVLA